MGKMAIETEYLNATIALDDCIDDYYDDDYVCAVSVYL